MLYHIIYIDTVCNIAISYWNIYIFSILLHLYLFRNPPPMEAKGDKVPGPHSVQKCIKFKFI